MNASIPSRACAKSPAARWVSATSRAAGAPNSTPNGRACSRRPSASSANPSDSPRRSRTQVSKIVAYTPSSVRSPRGRIHAWISRQIARTSSHSPQVEERLQLPRACHLRRLHEPSSLRGDLRLAPDLQRRVVVLLGTTAGRRSWHERARAPERGRPPRPAGSPRACRPAPVRHRARIGPHRGTAAPERPRRAGPGGWRARGPSPPTPGTPRCGRRSAARRPCPRRCGRAPGWAVRVPGPRWPRPGAARRGQPLPAGSASARGDRAPRRARACHRAPGTR